MLAVASCELMSVMVRACCYLFPGIFGHHLNGEKKYYMKTRGKKIEIQLQVCHLNMPEFFGVWPIRGNRNKLLTQQMTDEHLKYQPIYTSGKSRKKKNLLNLVLSRKCGYICQSCCWGIRRRIVRMRRLISKSKSAGFNEFKGAEELWGTGVPFGVIITHITFHHCRYEKYP